MNGKMVWNIPVPTQICKHRKNWRGPSNDLTNSLSRSRKPTFFRDFSRFGKFSKFHELEPTSTIFHLFSTNGSMCWARSRADSWTGWLAIFRVVLSWCLYAASRTKRVYMASTTQKVVKIVWKHTLPDNSWLTFNDDLFFV